MQYQRLGRTELLLSRLMLGGAAFGQQYGPVDKPSARQTLALAAEAGINFIDTSAYYGEGRSEELLGELLREFPREVFHIGTKAGRLGRDRFDFSATGMRRCLEWSLKRLRRDSVDLLLAHDIEYATDPEQIFTETAEALHQFKKEGLCRNVGMSCYPLGLLSEAIRRCQLDVVITYCHYTLQNDRAISELLPMAAAHGVGILNASPLAMGLLTSGGPPSWHPADAAIKAACFEAAEECSARNISISRLAMSFCTTAPALPFTITGTARVDELQQNLEWYDAPETDPALYAPTQAILAPVHNRIW
ncbi:MAG: aldo/keto reductase [Gemmataceae bacterium]